MQVLTNGFVPAPAVERLRAPIPELNYAVEVAYDDGFCGELQKVGLGAESRFALLQLLGALLHALLKLGVESFQHARLAMQLDKDSDFGAQHFWNDGNRDVIHGAAAIALDFVGVRKSDAGDEDDRRLLEARMLANGVGQLKAVHVWHAHVHQDYGDVGLEQSVQSFTGGVRLDEILIQIPKDNFVAQKLCRLVIDHQDINFLLGRHRFLLLTTPGDRWRRQNERDNKLAG